MDFDYIKSYITNLGLIKSNFMEVLKECFKFDGTLDRTKFFTYYFITFIVFFLCSIIIPTIMSVIPIVGWLIGMAIGLVSLIAFIAINIGPNARRINDAGFPSALTWLHLVCLGIVPLILAFFPSKNGGTQATQSEQPENQPPANN